jgi:NADPH-dependent glutamate synthase beta subunit-like oxidoreductase/coenzyme F420-reducing hydrogenase delta subunit
MHEIDRHLRRVHDDLVPPCQYACPLSQDVQRYIALAAQGKRDEAAEVIRRTNPLPSICGYICAHPCEDACRRGDVDEPLAIRSLKQYIMDNTDARSPYETARKGPAKHKRIAIVGSGPSGLTAAHDLALSGYDVTVFEKLDDAGGALRHGVPAYRLPLSVIHRDIEAIKALGVSFRVGMELGGDFTIDDLWNEGFDAVLLALGLPESKTLPLPQSDHAQVLDALTFLRNARQDSYMLPQGSRVVVVGAGAVAMDVTRTALRQGAAQVRLLSLEKKHQMPAHQKEIDEAQEEGVIMEHLGWGPQEIVCSEDGTIRGVRCKECVSVFDNKGRFNPQFNEENTVVVDGDTVIFAIGQNADIDYLTDMDIVLTQRGMLQWDSKTFKTTRDAVFSCGEIVTGPGLAVNAMAHGRDAALAIRRYFGEAKLPVIEHKDKIGELPFTTAGKVKRTARKDTDSLSPQRRTASFVPVEQPFSDAQAIEEARRCLNCGAGAEIDSDICASCLTCSRICPYEAPKAHARAGVQVDKDMCIGCGVCYATCPAHAISFRVEGVENTDVRITRAVTRTQSHTASPRILVIHCFFNHPEFATVQTWVHNTMPGVGIVGMPCLCKLRPANIMHAFEYGVDGILALGCAEDVCTYTDGDYWSRERIEEARRLCEDIGMPPTCIELDFVTGFTKKDLKHRIAGLRTAVKSGKSGADHGN